MAKTKKELPKLLRPYDYHGIVFDGDEGTLMVDCPFCGRAGKMGVDSGTGVWRCVVCETGSKKGGGNNYTFIRELHAISKCVEKEAIKLAKGRKFLYATTPGKWGCAISETTGLWIMPAYNGERNMVNLYQYMRHEDKHLLYPTPEMNAGMFGVNLFDPKKPEVWILETWNAPAVWEVINGIKPDGTPTANPELTIGAGVNVIGIPGAKMWQEAWTHLVIGKKVTIMLDSDHPKEHLGRPVGLAGFMGTKRTASLIAKPDGTGAAEVRWLRWGVDGYDPAQPSGYDVRDHLSSAPDLRGRAARLKELLAKVELMPADWIGPGGGKAGGSQIELEDCTDWDAVKASWREAVRFGDDQEYVLASALATAVTTRVPGAQVWLQILSPPSTLKTTLVEGLGVNKKWTHSVDKFSGFFSGYTDGTDKDFSPILKMKDKTLIIKEAASLLADGNRGDLMADLVSAWDRKSSRAWKNGKEAGADAINMTVLLLGTSTLRQMDMTETGGRFLTCTMMNEIAEDLEDDILERASHSAIRNMAFESNCTQESHHPPELLKAWQVTGGYLEHLRTNSNELLIRAQQNFPEKYRRACCDYAKFVAYLRARPSKVQDETADREMAARLVEQITKLAIGFAVVLQRPGVDAKVMKYVKRIAMDSAHGKSLRMVEILRTKGGEKGLLLEAFTRYTGDDEKKLAPHRSFMCKIGVSEMVSEPTSQYSIKTIDRIRLTKKLTKLYDAVMKE